MENDAGLRPSANAMNGLERQYWLFGSAALIVGLIVVQVITYRSLRSQMNGQIESKPIRTSPGFGRISSL